MLLGHIDLVDRQVVRGWAADTDRPYGTLEVAVFVDGRLTGLARADKARADLKDPAMLGAGVHGVAYQFDPPLSALQDHEVVVRFAEGGKLLGQWRVAREADGATSPNAPHAGPEAVARRLEELSQDEPTEDAATDVIAVVDAGSAKPAARGGSGALPNDILVGFIDECTRDGLLGWAACKTDPDQVLDISIFIDDRKVAQITCDQPREDLAEAGVYGDGARGYSYTFDPPLPDDRETRVTVTLARTGAPVTGGQVVFGKDKIQRVDASVPLAEDEPRLLRPPSDPRGLFELLGLYDQQGGLAQLLSRLEFTDERPESVHYSVFGVYPKSVDDVMRWGTYYARDHLHQLLLSDEFQTNLIPLLLRAFPEKRRLIFVHIPKCAGTDLTFHFRARYPSLDGSLAEPRWASKDTMLRRIARVVGHLRSADSIFVHGHVNLADYIAADVIRPTDSIFTIIREPFAVAISQINYILTRFDNDIAGGQLRPDTNEWADMLGLRPLPARMSDEFIKRVAKAALRHEDLVRPNSLASWLGGEGTQLVVDRLARFNVQVTDTERYGKWLLEAWGIDAKTRWNESKKFIGLDNLPTDDLAYLNSITGEDRRLYRTYQHLIEASGALAVDGNDLRGVVVP